MNILQPVFLEHCKHAKILNISEYDYTPTKQFCHTMGLGKDAIGVLIPDTKSTAALGAKLQKKSGLDGFNMNEPFFFGYSNNTKPSQWDKLQPLSFIRSVLIIAKTEGHQNNVQIITNIPIDTIRESGIELAPLVRQVEYYSSTGETDPISYPSSTATTTLKIFNPFPLDPDEFQALLHHSHPVTLCTGDQSLIENIFASKCIFYQVMSWKKGLSKAFADFVKEVCGEHSLYYHFVSKAIFDCTSLPNYLEKEWSSDPRIKEKIQSDAKRIADAIRQSKNFNTILPSLVNLSLLSEDKLDNMDTLINIHTSSQLLSILSACKKDNTKILKVLQSIQPQLPRIINTFHVFKKILNMSVLDDKPCSSIPVDSRSIATRHELLSILMTAMQENLCHSIEDTEQLYELFRLPLTTNQRGQILAALQKTLPSIITSFYELRKLFEVSNKQLTSEHCRQILSALQTKFGTWITSFYDLIEFFKLFEEQLTPELSTVILTTIKDDLVTLITSDRQLKELFKLSSENLTSAHRTLILMTLQDKLLSTRYDLINLFKLSNEQLSSEHRTYILTVRKAKLGSVITYYHDLIYLFQLSNTQLTTEHRSLILSALKEMLGTLFSSSLRLRDLFKIPNAKFSSEHRSIVIDTLQQNFGNLFKSYNDLLELFELSEDQLTTQQRIKILTSPLLRSLVISLNDNDISDLIKLLPDEFSEEISIIRKSTKNNDCISQHFRFFTSLTPSETKKEQPRNYSRPF
jgi:hypothetical protein